MKARIVTLLLSLVLRLAGEEVAEEMAAQWLRQQRGYLVLNGDQAKVTLAAVRYQRERLRKLGGGNLSKLRDPRKSLRRLGRAFERTLEEAIDGTTGGSA